MMISAASHPTNSLFCSVFVFIDIQMTDRTTERRAFGTAQVCTLMASDSQRPEYSVLFACHCAAHYQLDLQVFFLV
jgi:hypothetical protein